MVQAVINGSTTIANGEVQSDKKLVLEHTALFSLISRFLDALVIVVSAYAAYSLRFNAFALNEQYLVVVIFAVLLAMVLFPLCGLYHPLRNIHWPYLLQRLIVAWALLMLCLIVIGWATKTSADFSRLWLSYWAAFGFLGLFITHTLTTAVLSALRKQGWYQKRVLVAGIGDGAREVIRRLNTHPWTGFQVVAAADDDYDHLGSKVEGVPVIGMLKRIPQLVERHRIDEVWITLPLSMAHPIDEMLSGLRNTTANVRYIPDMQELRLLNYSVSDVAGLAVLNLSMSPMVGINRLGKFVEDYILGILILIATSPILLALAIGVKLSSPGPVFFRQKRHGWDGRTFECYKFRTMVVHEQGPTLKQATRNDSRVTKFGAFLRRTSLDELPQIFNVLKGDMSLVGPRPHAVKHNLLYRERIEDYMLRHKVKPGITGWAQINGWRGETDTDEKMKHRVEHDLYYIEHWSIWLDLKILVMTAFKGFVHENAY
ncbi:undecaprenyl-phosphate glucose phosphotransferase [Methylophaga lonarensis]|uniref:undecaprenyl-phosphate glucose phosphotransferase n=1 Tax=Methylophaga lonarensis TaxID=999151 RepID=UPI003D2C59E7